MLQVILQKLWRQIFGERVTGRVVAELIDLQGSYRRYVIEGENGEDYYMRLNNPPHSLRYMSTVEIVLRKRKDMKQFLEPEAFKYVEPEEGYQVLEYKVLANPSTTN